MLSTSKTPSAVKLAACLSAIALRLGPWPAADRSVPARSAAGASDICKTAASSQRRRPRRGEGLLDQGTGLVADERPDMRGALVRPAWRADGITRLTEGERHDDCSSLLLNSTATLALEAHAVKIVLTACNRPRTGRPCSGSQSPAKTSRLFTSQTEALFKTAAFELRGKRPRSRWPQSQAARASLAIHAPRNSLRCRRLKDHIRLWPWLQTQRKPRRNLVQLERYCKIACRPRRRRPRSLGDINPARPRPTWCNMTVMFGIGKRSPRPMPMGRWHTAGAPS